MFVAPTDAVSLLHVCDIGSDLLNNTDTLMAKDHVGLAVVLVGTAETGARDLEQDLVVLQVVLLGSGLLDGTGLGALENGEFVTHCDLCDGDLGNWSGSDVSLLKGKDN